MTCGWINDQIISIVGWITPLTEACLFFNYFSETWDDSCRRMKRWNRRGFIGCTSTLKNWERKQKKFLANFKLISHQDPDKLFTTRAKIHTSSSMISNKPWLKSTLMVSVGREDIWCDESRHNFLPKLSAEDGSYDITMRKMRSESTKYQTAVHLGGILSKSENLLFGCLSFVSRTQKKHRRTLVTKQHWTPLTFLKISSVVFQKKESNTCLNNMTMNKWWPYFIFGWTVVHL